MNIFGKQKMRSNFILFFLFFITTSAFSGSWNDKPVMCEQKDIALKVVKDKGEVPLFTGIQTTKVYGKDGLSTIPVHIPIQLFVNFKTKTYTVMEYHPSYNTVCVLSFGDDWKSVGEKG
tara:strand:+ start:24 stop:380 length:357 start_codon:yes stop_codon:yes gene_type:complete